MAAPLCNNPTLYNGALGGMVAGLNFSRANTGITTTYDSQVAAAKTFATAMDAAITALASLSASNATLVAGAGAGADVVGSRPALMFALCYSYWATRSLVGSSVDTTAGTYTTAVAAIKAQWDAILVESSAV